MVEVVRGAVDEAARLEVEAHVEDCESCRAEWGRWSVVGALREHPATALSAASQRRMLARVLASRPADGARARRPAGSIRRAALAACVGTGVAAVVAILALHGREPRDRLTESTRIEATEPGTVSFGGARIAYEDGAQLLADPPRRHLSLARGQVDVEVDPKSGLPGRFRVTTDRFIVEVLGTRFVVTPTTVRTLRGRVHILGLDERELAVLVAGESWTAPVTSAPSAAAPAPAVDAPASPALPPVAPPPLPTPPAAAEARARPAAAPSPSVTQLVARGRAAMSGGDVTSARAWIARARESMPSEAEEAALDLLEADAWLVVKQVDEAIAAYRRVGTRWFGRPEAETAAFAVGQLLAEGDSVLAAETALTEYLAHYPHGRFVREAREQLAQLQASK
jgi:hypothetical protein